MNKDCLKVEDIWYSTKNIRSALKQALSKSPVEFIEQIKPTGSLQQQYTALIAHIDLVINISCGFSWTSVHAGECLLILIQSNIGCNMSFSMCFIFDQFCISFCKWPIVISDVLIWFPSVFVFELYSDTLWTLTRETILSLNGYKYSRCVFVIF